VGAQLVKSDVPQDSAPAATAAQVAALGESNRAFGFELYRELGKSSGNLFFSPQSISTALAMIYAGARTTTETEMRNTLHFGADQTLLHAAFNATGLALAQRKTQLAPMSEGTGFELTVVNQAWGDKQASFLDPYLDVLAKNYGAGLFLVDFAKAPDAARLLINNWVAEQTKDRIKDLLAAGSIDSNVLLVLTNAIYFKASWLSKFDPSKTQSGTFHAQAGDRPVPMMKQVLEARYAQSADYQAVELPYVSPSVRMLVISPAQGRFDAVAQALGSTFDAIRVGLSTYTVTLAMPKLSFESTPKLKPALQALGMNEAFTDRADFSGLDGKRDIFIFDVVHKAFVAIDEAGTEAAAATAVIAGTVSLKPQATLTLDRPFIFVVYDEPTGALLFLGRFSDPG
jgi:serpin B